MEKPVNQAESPYELNRRLENILRSGTIAQVRFGKPARVRVKTGGLVSNWVPFMSLRAGGKARLWWPPAVGEQCLLLAPGGDLLQAVAVSGMFSDAMPQGSEDGDTFRLDWSDQDSMTVKDGDLVIECAKSITLKVQNTTLTLTPDGIFVTPDIETADTHTSLRDHLHTEVKKGYDNTGRPV